MRYRLLPSSFRKRNFYNGQYGVIFAALVEMHQQGIGADLVTIQAKLREMEIPPELTSVEYIGDGNNSARDMRFMTAARLRVISCSALIRKVTPLCSIAG